MPICVKDLTYVYNAGSAFQSTALEGINLTIEDGEFLALIGHTGSGKTTLVHHLNGLLKPTSGQVLVDGEDLNGEGVDRRKIRQRVGLVFQYPEYQLFEETVAKDVAFGPKNQGLSAEEVNDRVRYAMEAVHLDYDKYAEKSPFELSGGQMRRAAIAGVLAMKPKVLVLDEPAAGLDPMGRDSILDMIRELHSRGNVTVVMVSHSMDDVARLASRLVVMGHGKILACGAPAEIFSRADLIREAGLDVPEAVRLCDRLRAAGLPLPEGLYTTEAVRDALLRLWKERAAC